LTISSSMVNNGSLFWTVPNTLTLSSVYRIKVTSLTDLTLVLSSHSLYLMNPALNTISPTTFYKGDVLTATWSGFIGAVNVKIFSGIDLIYTLNTGTTSTSRSYTINTGWIYDTNNYTIRVASNLDSTVFIFSNEFQIVNQRITTPTGGENYKKGESLQINWTGYIDSDVKIELRKNTQAYVVIAPSVLNNGSYTYIIQDTVDNYINYKIRVTGLDGNKYFETPVFSITSGNVNYPVLNEETREGSSLHIQWIGLLGSSVSIKLLLNGVFLFNITEYSNNPISNNNFYWTVNNISIASQNYQVKIQSLDNPNEFAMSDNFTVHKPQFMSPSLGDYYLVGDLINVTWYGEFIQYPVIKLYRVSTNNILIQSLYESNDNNYVLFDTQGFDGTFNYTVSITVLNQEIFSDQFTVIAPGIITVFGVMVAGMDNYINWSSFYSNHVNINLYDDSDNLIENIADNILNNGSIVWNANGISFGHNYKIVIEGVEYGETNQQLISIANPVINNPSSGDVFQVNDVMTVNINGFISNQLTLYIYTSSDTLLNQLSFGGSSTTIQLTFGTGDFYIIVQGIEHNESAISGTFTVQQQNNPSNQNPSSNQNPDQNTSDNSSGFLDFNLWLSIMPLLLIGVIYRVSHKFIRKET
ncbi:MAG: hypothetical protein OEY49_14950, partial [Candidatus Heimdallarchaeota archaeon]|nr:hypothetical protein [Candidatus Heimdallarchaeota archaeon]